MAGKNPSRSLYIVVSNNAPLTFDFIFLQWNFPAPIVLYRAQANQAGCHLFHNQRPILHGALGNTHKNGPKLETGTIQSNKATTKMRWSDFSNVLGLWHHSGAEAQEKSASLFKNEKFISKLGRDAMERDITMNIGMPVENACINAETRTVTVNTPQSSFDTRYLPIKFPTNITPRRPITSPRDRNGARN